MAKFNPTVIATTQCNLRCTYCRYNQTDSYSPDKINFNALTSFLSGIEDELSEQVLITGGEPFLWPDLGRFLEFLHSKGKKALLNSNLTAQVDAALLKKYGARVETSLDGYNPETNAIRGTEIMFNRTLKNIEQLVAEGVPVGVTCVITSQNYQLAEFFKSQGASRISFQPVYIIAPQFAGLSLRTLGKGEVQGAIGVLEDLAHTPGIKKRMSIMRKYYVDGIVPDERCRMGQNIFVIEPHGNVYPCFFRYDLLAGNINTDTSQAIFEKLIEQSSKIRTKDCFGERCIYNF